MFNNFPYTNFHNLNLDWIVKTVKLLFSKSVFSVNGVEPDAEGNVAISGAELGAVGTVNNIAPVNGNVTLTASDVGAVAVGQGVTKVNGFGPDSSGNVLSGTVRSINGISPASLPTPGNVVLNASDVGALSSTIDPVETVNGISPDAGGNVNVGTVKSVNNELPDSFGNVNLPTVAGVTSVNGIGPDGVGNITNAIYAGFGYYVDAVNGSDDNPGTSDSPFKTIAHAINLFTSKYFDKTAYAFNLHIAEGTYNEYVNLARIPNEVYFVLDGNVTINGLSCRYMDRVNIQGNYTLTIEYNNLLPAYSSRNNALFEILFCTVKMSSNTTLNLVSNSNSIKGIYIAQDAKLIWPTTINASTLFSRVIDVLYGSTCKIYNLNCPSTNIGRITYMSDAVIHRINGGTDYTGTQVENASTLNVL